MKISIHKPIIKLIAINKQSWSGGWFFKRSERACWLSLGASLAGAPLASSQHSLGNISQVHIRLWSLPHTATTLPPTAPKHSTDLTDLALLWHRRTGYSRAHSSGSCGVWWRSEQVLVKVLLGTVEKEEDHADGCDDIHHERLHGGRPRVKKIRTKYRGKIVQTHLVVS